MGFGVRQRRGPGLDPNVGHHELGRCGGGRELVIYIISAVGSDRISGAIRRDIVPIGPFRIRGLRIGVRVRIGPDSGPGRG